MNWKSLLVPAALVALAGGVLTYSTCTSSFTPVSTSTPKPSFDTGTPLPAGSCHSHGAVPYVLPDANCTPGVLNPQVTPFTLVQTICRAGWTSTIRPPASYTDQLKAQQMREYGFTDSARLHEEDHLIPLELGGHPSDRHNLWPQPGAAPNSKDKVEDRTRQLVCAGTMNLAAAQQQIATDWVALGRSEGVF